MPSHVACEGPPLEFERRDPTGPDPFDRSRTVAFACHGCGDCCKGTTVLLSPFDLARLSAFAGEAPKALLKERCIVLKHPQTNLPTVMLETVPKCSFLDGTDRCTAYAARPLACRTYPLGILTDLNQPGWRDALLRFSLRANPCPPRSDPNAPLPVVRTLHEMATGASVEAYAEAYRVWARLTWDVATESRYPHMSVAEVLAFDREFVRLFFEEVEAPAEEGKALCAFVGRVKEFRGRHRLLREEPAALTTPRATTRA